MFRFNQGIVLSIAVLMAPQIAEAQQIYSNDFENAVGAEWSRTITSTTPIGARRFLGEFGNDNITLSLGNLPAHNSMRLEFDLFIIRTWDGNGEHGSGTETWQMNAGGQTLVNTTFRNVYANDVVTQFYPDNIGGTRYAPGTGASETGTLGYSWNGGTPDNDSVYHMDYTFAHTGNLVQITFAGIGLQVLSDESWGLDNVRLTAVPAPSSITTLLIGAFPGAAVLLRRRRK